MRGPVIWVNRFCPNKRPSQKFTDAEHSVENQAKSPPITGPKPTVHAVMSAHCGAPRKDAITKIMTTINMA